MSTGEYAAEPVRAVLLDLDGTLLDTAPDMGAALNALLLADGRTPLAPQTIRGYVSHGSTALVRLGFPHAVGAQFEALRARRGDRERRYVARTQTAPTAAAARGAAARGVAGAVSLCG